MYHRTRFQTERKSNTKVAIVCCQIVVVKWSCSNGRGSNCCGSNGRESKWSWSNGRGLNNWVARWQWWPSESNLPISVWWDGVLHRLATSGTDIADGVADSLCLFANPDAEASQLGCHVTSAKYTSLLSLSCPTDLTWCTRYNVLFH